MASRSTRVIGPVPEPRRAGRSAPRALRHRALRPDARAPLRQPRPGPPSGRRSAPSSPSTSACRVDGPRRSSRSTGRPTSTSTSRPPSTPGSTSRVARTGSSGWPDYRHRGPFGLADLLGQDGPTRHHGPATRATSTRTSLPTGPAGETRECLRAALVLVEDGADRLALLFRGAGPRQRHARRRRRGRSPAATALATAGHRSAARARPRAERLPRTGRLVRPQHVRRAELAAALPRATRPWAPTT